MCLQYGALTKSFPNSVRKCFFTCILFSLYSESLIRDTVGKENYFRVNVIKLNNIRFDTALFYGSKEDLQKLLNRNILACKEQDMTLNVKKTKVKVLP